MGPVVAGYTLRERLNPQGGHTDVFRAVQDATGNHVVVKCAPATAGADEAVRIRSEHAILSQLNHPGIVRVVELLERDTLPILVLELVVGQTLRDRLARTGPLDLEGFFQVAIELAEILQVVHASRLIHLDVNPSNVMVDGDGDVRLIDFGISTRVRREHRFVFNPKGLAGTLPYIAPEQTGRTNRSVDYRADLYSLGCTLYEVLCGRAPFEGRDPLEIVHQHIAKVPTPVDELRREVPRSVARVIGTLLAKNAEDRYQSAAGVAADLRRCRDSWVADLTADFAIGEGDVSALFAIPEALVGREAEVQQLLGWFESMPRDRAMLVMVAGYSGVGKSRLVREVQRPIASLAGYFCTGKFDQFQRHMPFAALSQALGDLVSQVLTEPRARVDAWRIRVLAALEGNGALLIASVPQLQLLIGPQAEVPELSPTEARHRYAATLRAFLTACCHDERPVAMFLDDLQWIDGATLEWIEDTLARPINGGLFLLGAYRDNEVDAAHPLFEGMDRMRAAGAVVQQLAIGPLDGGLVRSIVAHTLHRPESEVAALAELVWRRTGGNPFFLTQLLESLHDDGVIRFDPGQQRWVWDAAAAAAAEASPNVVDLVVSRLERLEPSVRRLLYIGACLGSRFDSGTLALAADASDTQAMDAMEAARSSGFLVRVRAEVGQLEWAFLHDRVQQAAFELVEDTDGALRRRVGWQMANAFEQGREDLLFGALQNLNPTRGAEADKARLAGLNRQAAERARQATAYGPALEHARLAVELEPSPTFGTAVELAWCEHLGGDDDAAETHFAQALSLAADDAEHARAYEARVHFFTDLARFPEAYAAGREGAAHFGHYMPASFVPPALIFDFAMVKLALRSTEMRTLVDHKEMSDRRLVVGARLAAAALKAAYQIRPELCVANAAKLVRVCISQGNFDDAPVAWLVLGSIFQGGVLGRHGAGYDWGRLAIDLMEKYDNAKQRAEVLFVYAYFANSWTKPLADSEQVFRKAWRAGQQSGDVFHASCATSGITQGMWMRGAPLDEVIAECDRFLPFLGQAQSWENEGTVSVVRQACRALKGLTEAPWELADADFDEAAYVATLGDYGSKHFAHFYAVDKLALAVLAENWEVAERMVNLSTPYLADSVGMQHAVDHHFYAALVAAQAGRPGPVKKQLKSFRAWAVRCPENFRHKALILEGEVARLAGRYHEAADAWDRAAEDAARNGFRQHEGLAMVRAARLHAEHGSDRAAGRAFREAIATFRVWGASALAERLVESAPRGVDPTTVSWRTTTAGTRRTSTAAGMGGLDAASLVKAGEALAAEVRLGSLLERMLDVVAENAGAQRVALLLPEGSDWRIQAERDLETGLSLTLGGTDWRDNEGIAASVVQYTLRTQKPVVVSDLREDARFKADPRAGHARAVLCMPLIHKARVRGLLYLENNLTVGGFTVDRVSLLEMLAGPMAVSVENAELYEQLEEKVRDRTTQLEQRNRLIRQTFGRYLSDDVVDTLLESPTGLAMGGERQHVTILMSDLRGFVSMSDRLSPEQVVQLLNNYLSLMTRIIFKHRGTIDEFLGDAILVVFGAPLRRPDDETRAVRCALEMQLAMDEVNAWNVENGLPKVEMGIGLHTGEVVVGNIGSEKRAKYGVVGQTVNLASRVESYTVGGQVLVSEATASRVDGLVIGSRMTVEPKGVREPMTIVEITGIEGDEPLLLEVESAQLTALREPIPVRLRALTGKDVTADPVLGRIVSLSEVVVEIESPEPFEPLTNLRFYLDGPDGEAIDGLYGKVPMRPPPNGSLRVRFTAIPPSAREAIASWLAASA